MLKYNTKMKILKKPNKILFDLLYKTPQILSQSLK
jgi:hypothetical protein